MADLRVHDPDLGVHDRPILAFTMVRNAHIIDAEQICGLSAEELARKAGLHDWYLTAYSTLSGAVHSTVRDLEKHFILGPSKLPELMQLAPSKEQTTFAGGVAGQLLAFGLPALAAAFKAPVPEAVKPLNEKLILFVGRAQNAG